MSRHNCNLLETGNKVEVGVAHYDQSMASDTVLFSTIIVGGRITPAVQVGQHQHEDKLE